MNHQLESLCAMYPNINVLFDAKDLKSYEFKVIIEENNFYKKYHTHLGRIALVSDRNFQKYISNMFHKFKKIAFRSFAHPQIEEARKWIFPSKLPG